MVHGTIVGVTTVLFYLVVAALIGLAVFFLAAYVFGRGEQMAPLDPRTSPAELPEEGITAEDVRKIRFALAVRGYRMSDVDWTLERLADRIDQLRRDNDELRGERPASDWPVEPDPVVAGEAADLAMMPDEPNGFDARARETASVGAHGDSGSAAQFAGLTPSHGQPAGPTDWRPSPQGHVVAGRAGTELGVDGEDSR